MSASNLYTVGARIVMHNEASPVLGLITQQLVGIHHHISQANAASTRFMQAIVGAGAALAGVGMIKGVTHLVDEGAKLVAVQNKMTVAGWKNKEIAEATAEAWRLSSKYQMIGVENLLEMQKEMAPVLGDRKEAMHMAELMAKVQVALAGTLGFDKSAQFSKQIRDAIRAGELSGNVLDPKRFETYLEGMAKTLKAFGGTLTPTDYFMATKYGRASAMNWSDEFTNTILPTIMQELGASSTGTAMMTAYQALVGGRMKISSINAFHDLGLIDTEKLDPGNLTPEGRIKRMKPGAIKGTDTFLSNPYEWVWQYLVPAMKDKGILTESGIAAIEKGQIKDGVGAEAAKKVKEVLTEAIVGGMDQTGPEARKAATKMIAVLFGDRTGQGLIDLLLLQKKKIERDKTLIKDAYGLDEGTKFLNEQDYKVAKHKMETQWENLQQALGVPGVSVATDVLNELADGINGLAVAANVNPGTVKTVMGALLGAAGALVVFGTVAVAGAVLGFIGAIPVLIGAIAGAIASIAIYNWGGAAEKARQLRKWISDMGSNAVKWASSAWKSTDFSALKSMVSGLAEKINAALGGVPGMVASAITQMASAIGAKIASALSSIANMIGGFFRRGGGGGGAAPPSLGDGETGGASGIEKQSYVPKSSGGQVIQANTTINMDGHRVASAVTRHIVQASHHVHAGSGYDGLRAPTPVDYHRV